MLSSKHTSKQVVGVVAVMEVMQKARDEVSIELFSQRAVDMKSIYLKERVFLPWQVTTIIEDIQGLMAQGMKTLICCT
jgi:hypothetical protein